MIKKQPMISNIKSTRFMLPITDRDVQCQDYVKFSEGESRCFPPLLRPMKLLIASPSRAAPPSSPHPTHCQQPEKLKRPTVTLSSRTPEEEMAIKPKTISRHRRLKFCMKTINNIIFKLKIQEMSLRKGQTFF